MYHLKNLIVLTLLLLTILSFSQEDYSDDVFHLVYKARLSEKDHFSSSGQRLKTAAAIIRQDRANFHAFNIKDSDDEYDAIFKDKESREYMEKTLYMSKKTEKSILNGTPIVKVEVIGDSADVSLISNNEIIFSDSTENEGKENIPPNKVVDFIFSNPSIIEQEQILECLKNNNLKINEYQKLLSAVKIILGDNDNEYYFVRGSKKNYCMAFYGANIFEYWLIEFNNSKPKVIFNNSSDDISILSSKSNGMNDIEVMSYTSLGTKYWYNIYKFYGNKYVISECFVQNNETKYPKKKKIKCL